MSSPQRPRAPDRALLSHLHPAADELVAAVHAQSASRVEMALQRAITEHNAEHNAEHNGEHGGDDALQALLVLLAAAVPDDAPVAELAVWIRDPAAYRRLRAAGTDPARACAVIADRIHRQETS